MTEVASTPATNGVARPAFRDRLAEEIRGELARLDARREELAAELAEVAAEMKAYQKSLAPLVDEPDETKPRLGRPPGKTSGPLGGTTRTRIGPERMALIERTVRELIAADPNGEVRQIDVCEATGFSSAVMSSAFYMLRDADVLRVARIEGKSKKWYRLTRSAQRDEGHEPVAPTRSPTAKTRETVLDAIQHYGRPATLAAISELTGISDVALRNAVHTLEVEGVVQDIGPAEQRADGATHGKMPRLYAPAVAEGQA